MAYNRIHYKIYENHNWCRICNLITKDKSVLRCPECKCKVRIKPHSYGKVVLKKIENKSTAYIKEVNRLLDIKRNGSSYYSARMILEKAKEKTGLCLIEI